MFFLLRCAFWLGIVFYAMDWPSGAVPAGAATARLGEVATAAAGAAVASAAPAIRDLCLSRPAACLALATGSAAKATLDPPAEPPKATAAAPLTPAPPPPLPPRRPNRLG